MGDARLRTIGVITTARSEYGILLPVLRAIERDPTLQLHLIAGGMHLAPEFGLTVNRIIADGFTIGDRVDMILSSDAPIGTAKSIALGVAGFAESFERNRPDILLATGDRFEMHSAVLAALPFNIPVAHIHGGEVTAGAMDDALRHGITKMSHLHFAATETYAKRLRQLGEDPWRITVTGAPSLDNLRSVPILERSALERELGITFDDGDPLLVTVHPMTRDIERTREKIEALLKVLEGIDRPKIFTLPNADPGGRLLSQRISDFAQTDGRSYVRDNLGTQLYFSLMQHAAAMVGNSSSGIIEAASFGCPVVNIGRRQEGRVRGANVIDVSRDEDQEALREAILRATGPKFKRALAGMQNPYGDGHASEAIVSVLRSARLDPTLLIKHFYDLGP